MANIFEYIISLKDQTSGAAKKIESAVGGVHEGIQNVVQKTASFQNKMSEAFGRMAGKVKESAKSHQFLTKSIDELEEKLQKVNEVRFGTVLKSEFNQATKEAKALEKQIERLKSGIAGSGIGSKIKGWFSDLKNEIPVLKAISNPLVAMAAGTMKAFQYARESVSVYKDQSTAIAQLGQVMRNTMNARQGDIKSIQELARAQQQLGVISDNVQLAGAQELATYLTRRESLEKILPAMNDMLAQQYGLNATSEQAVTVASMLGKVMDGQVGALSRYGYAFDEVQENILKTGTEAERAAVLFEVVNSAVGGVNKALLQTPEGRLKKAANETEDIQERIGRLFVLIKDAWNAVSTTTGNILSETVSFFEKNQDTILSIVSTVAKAISGLLNAIMVPIRAVVQGIGWVINKFREGHPVFVGLAIVIGAITTSLMAMQAWQMLVATWAGIVASAKAVWTAVTWGLNAALLANPIGLIIAGIVALIAAIAWVVYSFDGWGDSWDGLVGFLKNSLLAYVQFFKTQWLTVQDAFLGGIELMQQAWYKLKSLWDDGAKEELEKINAQQNERAKAIAESRGKIMEYMAAAVESTGKIGLKRNDKTMGDLVGGIKSKLGIGASGMPGAGGVVGVNAIGAGGVGSDATAQSREAIATGGTKNTTINIKIDKQVETINMMTGNLHDTAQRIRDVVVQEMSRAVAMAGALAG